MSVVPVPVPSFVALFAPVLSVPSVLFVPSASVLPVLLFAVLTLTFVTKILIVFPFLAKIGTLILTLSTLAFLALILNFNNISDVFLYRSRS